MQNRMDQKLYRRCDPINLQVGENMSYRWFYNEDIFTEALEKFDDLPACPTCGGWGCPLEKVEGWWHYRCRNCGIEWSLEE